MLNASAGSGASSADSGAAAPTTTSAVGAALPPGAAKSTTTTQSTPLGPTSTKGSKSGTASSPAKIRYIVKRVNPDLPSGALIPSKHAALSLPSFVTPGGNVGCTLSSSQVRCEIVSRSWSPPAQPSSCTGSWGKALVLSAKGLPAFACGGLSAPVKAGVIPYGSDDTIGDFTCQIRTFGVDCFNTGSGSGLLLSRTGYTTY